MFTGCPWILIFNHNITKMINVWIIIEIIRIIILLVIKKKNKVDEKI